jgi:hypothetical protein
VFFRAFLVFMQIHSSVFAFSFGFSKNSSFQNSFDSYQLIGKICFSNTNILYCFHGAFELTPYVSHKRHVVNSNVSYRVIKYAHTYHSSNILFIIFTVIITKVKSTIIELELPH